MSFDKQHVMGAAAVTQADRDAAAEWGFIECRHCSEYEGNFVDDLAADFAKHRLSALIDHLEADGGVEAMRERCAALLEVAINQGYPTPAGLADQCVHGKFGWEDCIACYDERLTETIADMRALPVLGVGR